MLAALEDGVKGGRWYSLKDKLVRRTTLSHAFEDVRKNGGAAGVDHQTVKMFEHRLEEELGSLLSQLAAGSYRPRAVRRTWIPKPGSQEKRPLGIPTVRDRVVQTALKYVLEPIFERQFAEHSYGFRPGRGCKDALRRVSDLLRQGYVHVVDADLKAYFDSIPHEKLMDRVEQRVADKEVLKLVRAFLDAKVMDGLETWQPEKGSPQGAVISPLLANIYLDPLDHQMAGDGFEMVRYADDFVVLCRSEDDALRALAKVRAWTEDVGLTLHPEKTRVVDAQQQAFEFLGYRFDRGRRFPRRKSEQKLKATVRARTSRTNGNSLKSIVQSLNPVLRGWFEYFKHSHKTVFPTLDGFVRRRIRSILRKRSGRKGSAHGHGADQTRWPNAFFDRCGLWSMTTAYALACQPATR